MNTPAYFEAGRPVSSAVFYAVACDPQRSVAVEACAGSGKTWLLVSRILRALLDGVQPHEILAITFTRKAAGEMRERLQDWLAEFASADDEHLRQALQDRGVARPDANQLAQLRGLYLATLQSGRPVQIRTFHSWFAALLGSAPLAVLQRLDLPSAYELLEDDEPAVAAVWRRFHARLLEQPALLADFQAVVKTHGRHQTEEALAAALARRVEFALADAAGRVESGVQPFGQQYPDYAGLAEPEDRLRQPGAARELLFEAAAVLGRASQASYSDAGQRLERGLGEGRMDVVTQALLTAKNEPRKFGEKLAGIEVVRHAQDLLLQVQGVRRQHEAWLFQQRMTRLSHLLLAEFAALKRARGWVDMNDVERAAQVMLADPVLSGWVQERLDSRTRHLLIDEFQDTSPLQWQALYAWLSGYAGAAQAPAVFIVGDPKQSIYRFRRAEPQVFQAAQAFVAGGLGGSLLQCDHTRRNARAVTGLVNEVMGALRAAGDYPDFRDHSTAADAPGQLGALEQIRRDEIVRAAPPQPGVAQPWRDSLSEPRFEPEERLRTLEARQAARWIAGRLAAGVAPEDIMVLSRKRERLGALQEELRRLRVPVQQPEKTELIEAPEVQDIVALLDALVSTQHDLSLARALKSPLFGLRDDELIELAQAQRGQGGSWWSVLMAGQDALSPVWRSVATRLLRYQDWVRQLPPHDALELIFHDADVPARFGAAAPDVARDAVLANLRSLLGAALQVDGARYATPYGLVRSLRAAGLKAPAALQPGAVRLLTIHGAKGLEADHVLLLDTDTPARQSQSMSVLIDWPGASGEPLQFVFLASESRPPACALALLARERAEREREEFNALYVALTRARRELVISSVEPHRPAEGSWWQRLLPSLPPATRPAADAGLAPADPAVCFELPELPAFRADDAGAARPAVAAASSLPARIGQAMHRLLEWQWFSSPVPLAVGRQFQLGTGELEQALAMARRIREGPAAWAWDGALLAWQGNEVELSLDGQLLRLDRLVQRRDDGHWWVLDYKSAESPGEQQTLREQLSAYRRAVQAAYPGQVVRMAFITGTGQLQEHKPG